MLKTVVLACSLFLSCSPALPVIGARHPASPEAPAPAPSARPPTLRPTATIDEVAPLGSETAAPPGHAHHHGGHP